MTAIGRLLAERVDGRPADDLELPVTPLRPIPLHQAASAAVDLGQRVRALLDRIEAWQR